MAGSRTTRAGTKRTTARRRAVGTRDRIIAHLVAVSEIADPSGMASNKLAEAVGYPGSSVAFAQLLSGMERDGLIARDVRGKRTYRITLSGATAAARPAPAADALAVSGPAGAIPAQVAAAAVGDDVAAIGADPDTAAASRAAFDYDELARRLLIQVVRRLAATPTDLEQAVAGLERELATAWSRHGTLTAENVRLRQQLRETQRNLDLAREHNRRLAITDELDQAEVVLLERLLTPDEDGDGQEPRPRAGGRAVS